MTTPTNSHKAWTNKGGHVNTFLKVTGGRPQAPGCTDQRDVSRVNQVDVRIASLKLLPV